RSPSRPGRPRKTASDSPLLEAFPRVNGCSYCTGLCRLGHRERNQETGVAVLRRGTMKTAAETNPDPPAVSTILVVDDEVLIRLAIVEELRSKGLMAFEPASGDEAILILKTANTIGLVITDVHMPGNMDGYALVAWLRQEMPHIKVIMMSG